MRRSISKIPYRPSAAPSSVTASFSTSSGGGGRGRGGPNPFSFTIPTPSNDASNNPNPGATSPPPHGHGRGRGVPVNSSPGLPSFNSFLNNDSRGRGVGFAPPNHPSPPPPPPGMGRGVGFAPPNYPSPPPPPPGMGRGVGFPPPNFSSPQLQPQPPTPPANESKFDLQPPKPDVKKLFQIGEAQSGWTESETPPPKDKALPTAILGILSGAGRGKPTVPSAPHPEKTLQTGGREPSQSPNKGTPPVREQLSQEEKVRKAKEILSKGDTDGGFRADRGEGRGYDGSNRYEERGDQSRGRISKDGAVNREKLAKKLGPEIMNKVVKGLEEMASKAVPDPHKEALVNAFQTDLMLECLPEYFMEEFGTNPDIDDKAPMPLRVALEKMKPFLMSYEGIQSQEDWEEIMEETMQRLPLLKKAVQGYGPDRATAKHQCAELERVAKTLPASAPASVKRFTDRAVLSLQSNSGWGFNKKSQFMDKLVMEVEQHYK